MGAVVHASIVRRAQRLRCCTNARSWRGEQHHCTAGRRARPVLVPRVHRRLLRVAPANRTTARDVVLAALSRR
ncbi:hypothetical protein DGM85_08740 [Xanthomonas phaseoli pv. phaseoli]|nr:hypothetical protein DGM93_08510 [Xanthomonas phaseoli pv. phaseoli]QWN31048.1 hypothetical protein DGM85_08740 [Xanthomonas phaseoli pv. phaseoli]QWN35174.1 hypothetical protein DGM81_08530 [Xanthomonas phaseoli pv. phaseoli]RWU18627.1 hypothetical protein XANMN_08275 [Xanthomonas phaseoli pv. manihotis str. CIO151]